MKKQILICNSCHTYTLKKICSKCKKKTNNPRPARYSITDNLGKYRRLARKEKD